MDIEELKQLRKNLDKLKDEINEIEEASVKWKEEIDEVIDTITFIISTKNK